MSGAFSSRKQPAALAGGAVHGSLCTAASVPVGPNDSFTLVVTAEHLANRFKDATLPPVLATPVMIMATHNAALNAIKPFLGARESAAETRIEFNIEATDGVAPIGSGTHERMVIDMVRFVERLNLNSA